MKKTFLEFLILVVFSFCFSECMAVTDISGTKYEDAVTYLIENKITTGYPDNTFRPEKTITRAEISVVVTNFNKIDILDNVTSKFIDIDSHWGKSYINTLANLGVVSGYENNDFRPDNEITYAEVTTMVLNSLGYKDEIAKINLGWPNNYTSKANSMGLYKNLDASNPNKKMTRGEVAIFLYNFKQSSEKSSKLPEFKIEEGILDLGEKYEEYKVAYDTTAAWYVPSSRYLSENKNWASSGYEGTGKGWYPYCLRIIISNGVEEKTVRMVKNGVEVPIYDGEMLDLGENWKECSIHINGDSSLITPIKKVYSIGELKGAGLDIDNIFIKFEDAGFGIEYNTYADGWELHYVEML